MGTLDGGIKLGTKPTPYLMVHDILRVGFELLERFEIAVLVQHTGSDIPTHTMYFERRPHLCICFQFLGEPTTPSGGIVADIDSVVYNTLHLREESSIYGCARVDTLRLYIA